MNVDARLSVALPTHPKTKRLLRRLGAEGAWHLVRLFLWASQNRTDGDLSGLADEDIELAIDWPHEVGSFVSVAVEVGFLEGGAGVRRIHDWQDHNPWAAGASGRAEHARQAAQARWAKKYGGEAASDGDAADLPADAQGNAVSTEQQCPNTNTNTNTNSNPEKKAPAARAPRPDITFDKFRERCKTAGEKYIPPGDPIFAYADGIRLPNEFLRIAWLEFARRFVGKTKRYKDWRQTFRNYVENNWLGVWVPDGDGWKLSSRGIQYQRAAQEAA